MQATGAASAEVTNTSLVFDSDPGDWIGGGDDHTWYPADGSFAASSSAGRVTVDFRGSDHWWTLNLNGIASEGIAVGGDALTFGPGRDINRARWPPSSPATWRCWKRREW